MNTRLLGLITMLTAPGHLLVLSRHGFAVPGDAMTDPVDSALRLAFAAGWLCGLLGLRGSYATGASGAGRLFVTLPLVTIPLAALQEVLDLVAVGRDSPVYGATDLAWPSSMLLTLLVGLFVLRARQWVGWRRFVPLFCGLALPNTLLLNLALGEVAMRLTFPLHTALGWSLLGYAVFSAQRMRRERG